MSDKMVSLKRVFEQIDGLKVGDPLAYISVDAMIEIVKKVIEPLWDREEQENEQTD